MKSTYSLLLLVALAASSFAQSTYIDNNGTWRYSDSGKDVYAFGVNYAPMFAHSFRRIKQLGLDHKEAIRQDVYHFSRLGLDAFRIHIWETEITDHQGNLLENEHLDLFDFTVAELRKRRIQILLTPLGLLKNGYPDDATQTPGFHNLYDKQACSRNTAAFKIQANYLKQLMEHVNPYTGLAYNDDPALIGIELNNEPFHKGTKEQTRKYIKTLINALRGAGFKNPLFYNMSQNPYLRETYYKTDINGFSFQWYPTGLSGNEPFNLNLLPYINEYPLYTPHFNFGREKEFKRRARIIYECGLSNTRSSYAYAPVAEALRNAGFQFAAYFSYDPMAIAAWNTEYPKHFMNLAYTPRSAIGLMIAAEAFRGSKEITYNAERDQALLNDGTRYIYSNGSETPPKQATTLKQIAGTGSSPLVAYEGTGAYFLDRLNENAWRLEVMPDAITLRNPFSYRPTEKAAGVAWTVQDMQLNLPGLDESFTVTPLTNAEQMSRTSIQKHFSVEPGVYLLGSYSAENVSTEFAAPEADAKLPPTWTAENKRSDNVLVDDRNQSGLFFSQGSRRKANRTWDRNPSITAQANCYGWDPKFVQFGYAVTAPQMKYRTLKLTIKPLHNKDYPIQVELGMNDGQIFGTQLKLKPGKQRYEVPLNNLKPVALARHDANPSFLPARSTFKASKTGFDLARIESLRFTIGPGLNDKQKKHELGLSVEKAWVEK